jgi:5-aminopentanamidase
VRVIPGGLAAAHARPVEISTADRGWKAPSVASINLGPKPGDLEGNLRMAEEEVLRAKYEDPSIKWVVLPELFTSGYSDLENISRHAEDAEHGMSVWRFSALAHELDLFIAYGFPEELPGGGVATSANLVGPGSGGPLLTYRKINLVETTPEHRVFTPGAHLPSVEAGGVRVSLAICWDIGHPETIREAAKDGAELILAPAAWRDPWGKQYDLACAARALDNAVYLASANQKGEYPEASFGASGGVFGPDGGRMSGDREGVCVAPLDPYLPERWRTFYGDTLHNRPPGTLEEACS